MIDEIRKNAPSGATHYWKNEYGCAYYCFCEVIKKWLYYDKYHEYWFSIKYEIIDKIKPLY